MMNKDELALTFPFNISLLLLIFFKPALKKGKCQDIDQWKEVWYFTERIRRLNLTMRNWILSNPQVRCNVSAR